VEKARSLEEQIQSSGLSSWREEDFGDKSTTGEAGLGNQGATCYLNSLLQTLRMTPEFLSILFAWRYDPVRDGEADASTPLQLQRLFARLILGARPHYPTAPLTRSFGWNAREVYEQQDVQELCRYLLSLFLLFSLLPTRVGAQRVLFEAIEKAFAAMGVESPINKLYGGELYDYLRCTVCGYSRRQTVPFMDVQLVIRGFSSILDALDGFVLRASWHITHMGGMGKLCDTRTP
jgi:ubiquitin carboxyl-terminal hydrolase 7